MALISVWKPGRKDWKEEKGNGEKKDAGGMEEKHFYKEDKTNFPKGNWKFNSSNLHGKWKAKKSGLNSVCIVL